MPISESFDLNGRVAVVTGGNGGIGRSIAIGLAKAGLRSLSSLVTRRRTNSSWVSFKRSSSCLSREVDVTERGQLQPSLEKVEETLGPVSILVNNAGISAVAASSITH